MKLQLDIVGSTHDQLLSLKSSFARESALNPILNCITYQDIQNKKLSPNADFIIFYFTSTSISATNLPLDNINLASKIICYFESSSTRSQQLEQLGFTVVYSPCPEDFFVNHIKEKLSVELNTEPKRPTTNSTDNTLVFSSMDRYVMVEKDKLVHASSSGNYTTLYLSDQKEITVTKQLGKVASKLPDSNFFRVHHGHIVNRMYIKTILKKNQLLIVLRNSVKVPVSRRRKKEFLSWLGLC